MNATPLRPQSAFAHAASNDNIITDTTPGPQKAAPQQQSYDLFGPLMKDRIIFLEGEVSAASTALLRAQLMYLDATSDEPITLIINSPGGIVSGGMAVYDTIQSLKSPVHTKVLGRAASMGSVLLCAGTPGERSVAPNAYIMIHQPSGGMQGTASEIAVSEYEIQHTYKRMSWIYAAHAFDAHKAPWFETEIATRVKDIQKTPSPDGKKWKADDLKMTALAQLYAERMRRDHFMYAEEAKDMGLVDKIEYPDAAMHASIDKNRAKTLGRIADAERLANTHHRDNRPATGPF